MKNITVSVDEETHRISRIVAAEAGTSLSEIVRRFLNEVAASRTPEDLKERSRRLREEIYASIEASGSRFSTSDNLPGEEPYNRETVNRNRDIQSKRESFRRLRESVLEELRAAGGGLRSSENLTREELYDRDELS